MSLYLGENLISGQTTLVGESRNIGQIISSTIPLTDAGLHLLDGSLIQGSGIYSAFVTAMAAIYETNPELFCTESEWQDSITQYGVCSKFVYDSVNNTVRLPKLYSNERYLIDSSSSGTQWYRVYSDGWCEQGGRITSGGGNSTVYLLKPFKNTNYTILYSQGGTDSDSDGGTDTIRTGSLTIDSFIVNRYVSAATSYWQANGYIDISGYQNTEKYEYIVLATSTKTDIQVDIDEVVTDLNGKADVDLSNINPTQNVKNTIVGWGMPDYSAGITLTWDTQYTAQFDCCVFIKTSAQANAYINIDGVDYNFNATAYVVGTFVNIPRGSTFKAHGGNSYQSFIQFPMKGAN